MKKFAISLIMLMSLAMFANAFACDGADHKSQAPTTSSPNTSGTTSTAK